MKETRVLSCSSRMVMIIVFSLLSTLLLACSNTETTNSSQYIDIEIDGPFEYPENIKPSSKPE